MNTTCYKYLELNSPETTNSEGLKAEDVEEPKQLKGYITKRTLKFDIFTLISFKLINEQLLRGFL